jgi:hypothetical protein
MWQCKKIERLQSVVPKTQRRSTTVVRSEVLAFAQSRALGGVAHNDVSISWAVSSDEVQTLNICFKQAQQALSTIHDPMRPALTIGEPWAWACSI